VGALADRLDRGGDAAVAGEHHHHHRRLPLLEVLDHGEPVRARHAQVDHRAIERHRVGDRDRGGVIGGGVDGQAAGGERLAQPLAQPIVVVDHQDRERARRHGQATSARGRRTVTQVPRAAVDSIASWPPRLSTNAWVGTRRRAAPGLGGEERLPTRVRSWARCRCDR
jgi:hypothetical protein